MYRFSMLAETLKAFTLTPARLIVLESDYGLPPDYSAQVYAEGHVKDFSYRTAVIPVVKLSSAAALLAIVRSRRNGGHLITQRDSRYMFNGWLSRSTIPDLLQAAVGQRMARRLVVDINRATE